MKKTWNILSEKKQRYENENIAQYLLRLRGVRDNERFMHPAFRDMYRYTDMKNIELAASLIIDGIKGNLRFCVYYDTDLDGVSAGTIMYKYLECHDITSLKYKINLGKIHGIGHLDTSEFDDIDVLVIVDSLDNNYKIYDKLSKLKDITIIVLDHHEFKTYPENAVLVSSALNYKNKHLSGSGVTWKMCSYLDTLLETNYAKSLVDLAACGIVADVCDVSEVSYENRYIVNCGLNNLQNLALKKMVGSYDFSSQSIIWSIAPLINAANRTKNNILTVELFLEEDETEIKTILKQLKALREEQNASISNFAEELEIQIHKNNDMENDKVIFGIVNQAPFTGLIATKISNKYQKPTIIFYTHDNPEILKGSIRAYGINNFKSIINKTKLAECFGHEAAAGIVCDLKNVQVLKEVLNEQLKNNTFELKTNVDLLIRMEDVTFDLIAVFEKVSKISGKNFKAISVCLKDVEIYDLKLMQGKHTKFSFNGIDFLKWNDTEIHESIMNANDGECDTYMTIDVIGELSMNEFAGKKGKQFIISDYDNIMYLPEYLRE